MSFVRDITNYKFYSLQFIILFTIIFTSIVLIPFYIEDQQSFLIGQKLKNLPYHDSYATYNPVNNISNYISYFSKQPDIEFVKSYSLFKFYEFEITNQHNFLLNATNGVNNLNFYSFDNATYQSLQESGSFNLEHQLNDSEIILDSTTANALHVGKGDTISFVGYINTPLSSYSYYPVKYNQTFNFSIASIIDDIHQNPSYNFLTFDYNNYYFNNYYLQGSSAFSAFLNRNRFKEIEQIFYKNFSYDFSQNLVIKYQVKNYSTNYLINQFSYFKLKELAFESYVNPFFNLDQFNYNYNLALTIILNSFRDLASLQIFFFILQIPLAILLFAISTYLIKYWIDVRKHELFVLYKSGMSESTIISDLKNTLRLFIIVSTFLSLLIVVLYSLMVGFTLDSLLTLFILLILVYFTLLQIYLAKMKISFDKINPINNTAQLTISENTSKLEKIKLTIAFLGSGVMMVSFIILLYNHLVNTNQIFDFNGLLFTFIPLIGIYGSTKGIFWLVSYISRKSNWIVHQFSNKLAVDDLIRNKDELFKFFFFLAFGFSLLIAPIIATNTIDNNTQTQLGILYGTEYSTGFYSSNYNLSTISSQLNAIPNLSWTVILKSTGSLSKDNTQFNSFFSSQLNINLYFIDNSYLAVTDQQSNSKLAQFNHLTQNTCMYSYSKGINYYYYNDYFNTLTIPKLLGVDYRFNGSSVSNKFISQGSLDYVPGAFLSAVGFQAPDSQVPFNVHPELDIFTKLNNYNIVISNEIQVNFLLSFNSSQVDQLLPKISTVLQHDVIHNKDSKTGQFLYPNDFINSYGQISIVRTNIITFSLILAIIMIVIFIIVFVNKFIYTRQFELGVLRSKGYSRLFIYKLIVSELLFTIITGLFWSIFISFLYAYVLAINSIRTLSIPIYLSIDFSTQIVILSSLILFIIVSLIVSGKILFSKISKLLHIIAFK